MYYLIWLINVNVQNTHKDDFYFMLDFDHSEQNFSNPWCVCELLSRPQIQNLRSPCMYIYKIV